MSGVGEFLHVIIQIVYSTFSLLTGKDNADRKSVV